MKKIVASGFACVAVSLSLAPSLGLAQFGNLGGLTSALGGGKSSANAGADIGAQQDALVRNYVAAGKDVLKANGHFGDALGIKTQALNATTTSDSLTAKDIEAQDKAISADAAAVADAIKAGATLKDAESKAKYAQGLVSLISGVKKYKDMSKDAQGFSSGMSANPMMLTKLESGIYVVKNLPSGVTNLSSSLKSAIDFARSNGVEVPADATSVL